MVTGRLWQVGCVAAVLRSLAWLASFLAALGLLAAWLVPPRLDWSSYRDELQRIASEQLGREFRIDGPFTLTLLPAPRLVARGVVIGEEGDSVTGFAEELRLTLALGRLLAGEIAVEDLTLVAPRITIRDVPLPIWAAALRPAPFLAGTRVSLERGEIMLGTVRLADVSGRLSAQGPLGPYTLAGGFRLGGLPVEAQLTLGRAGIDGAATLEAGFFGRGTRVGVSGVVLHGGFVFSGRVEAEGPDLSVLLPAPALPFRGEARLAVEGGAGSADQLTLQVGPSRLSGAVSFATQPDPRVDVALAGVRFALDPWVVPARGALASPPFPIGLDLSLEAAEIAGGVLRALRASAIVADGQVAVNEASAVLPGGAAVAVAGAVLPTERGPRFEGLVELDAPDLPALLGWLGQTQLAEIQGQAGQALPRTLVLSARIAAEAGFLQLEQAAGRLDGVALEGGIVFRPSATAGAPPQLGAGLRLTRVTLDAIPALPIAGGAAGAPAIEANLRLEVDELVLAGVAASDVSIDATLAGGRLALRRLTAADLAGGRLVASAAAELGARPRLTSFELDFAGADASRLAALVPGSAFLAGAAPVWQGGFAVRAAARTAGDQLEVTAVAELLDGRIEAAGSTDHGFERVSGRVALRHPGAPRLLALLGLDGTEAWLGEGSLAIVAEAAIAGRKVELRSAEVVAGRLRARGAGEVAFADAGGRFRLALESEMFPLPPLDWSDARPRDLSAAASWTGTVTLRAAEMPFGTTGGLSAVELQGGIESGTIRIASLTGRLRGGSVTGSASLTGAGALAIDAVVVDAVFDRPQFDLPFDFAGGSVGLTASVTAQGASPSAWLASLGGQGRLVVASGALIGFNLAAAAEALSAPLPEAEALARVRRALSGGATGVEQLAVDLRAERGLVTIASATFRAPSGHGGGTGEIDLRAEAMDLTLSLTPVGGAEALPELGLRVSGPMAAPRRVVETAAAARFLAERARTPRR